MTNNEAEYEAVISGLKLAFKYGAWRLVLHYISQLVVNQVTRTFQIKEQTLQKYKLEIYKPLQEFDEFRLKQIPRAKNIEADSLAKLAIANKNINKENLVILLHSAIGQVEVHTVNLNWDWRNHLVVYLQDGMLPQVKKETTIFRIQEARYNFVNGYLYNRTFGDP